MTKKTFNVQEWLATPEQQHTETKRADSYSSTNTPDKYTEVLGLIEAIELSRADLTSSYEDWRNIGFALADEFGENGRELFHRVSSFYPDYSQTICNKQFDNCLKANGSGVNVNTLFYLAKQAGISISKTESFQPRASTSKAELPVADEVKKLPTLPDSIFPQLPDFLKKIVEVSETNEERDLLLLGSMVTLSAAFPKLYGIYHNKKVFANLFLFVSAQASAGKGRLNHCRKLVKPIHDSLKEQSKIARQQYELDMAEYHANKKKQPDLEKPDEPPFKLLFIPANSSAAGAFQLLNENEGRGLIFETEGDTLANTFKSDFGNYSDGFRKSFHHETITYYRKTDRELVDLDSPCLSTVLSGTPSQVLNLIPSAEDGLFSRFMFYYMNMQHGWLNVFASNTPTGLDDYFYELGKEFYGLYQALQASPDMQFVLTKDQEAAFNQFFSKCFQHYFNLKGEEYIGTIRRLGLITFRVTMILSAIRLMDSGEIPTKIICEEQDFKTALSIAETLIVHASHIFNQLPNGETPMRKLNKRERFYETLPDEFNRQTYVDIAQQIGVKDKTAQGYITNFVKGGLLHRDEKDAYTKPNTQSRNDTPTGD
ncbi:DUF3987 domain-containing protein [Fulvivirga sp.]|uniref:DUF3987 domain-containing protein n=1 Tax=Fulvivirga sp. TaxID=1931237 RepID=UPI0032EC7B09